jgi:hypothetical protein
MSNIDDNNSDIKSNNDDISIPTEHANNIYEGDFFFISRFKNENTQKRVVIEEDIPKNTLKDKINAILKNLYKAYELNRINKQNILKEFEYLTQRQNMIDQTLEKIKRVNRTKQKKHVKYLRYIPLNKIYYYSPKKNHFYYILMDLVIKSRKKHSLNGDSFNFQDEDDEDKLENKSTASKRNSTIDYSSKINKSTLKRTINRYKFKEEEDEILKKLMLFSGGEFIDWQSISKEFNEFISSNIVDKDKFKIRSPLEFFTRSLELSDFYTYQKWSDNEDQILKKAILYYGPKNWQQISYCLEGRNNSQAFHRWMKGINPKIKRSKWSFEEDLTLGISLKIYGNKKWSKIANHLGGRTDIQCRERFCNILDPSLEEVEWKPHEDAKLLMLYDKMKNKWSKIAKEFGNRTDNTCWRRWKYLESIRKTMGSVYSNNILNNSYSAMNMSISNFNNSLVESEINPEYSFTKSNIKELAKKKLKKKEIFKVIKVSKSHEEESIN